MKLFVAHIFNWSEQTPFRKNLGKAWTALQGCQLLAAFLVIQNKATESSLLFD